MRASLDWAVLFAVENHNHGKVPNARMLKESLQYTIYRETVPDPLPKFKAYSRMISELEDLITKEVMPLQTGYDGTRLVEG